MSSTERRFRIFTLPENAVPNIMVPTRLGGNSLLGALYGGRVAAKSACEQADVVDLSCATQIDFPPTSQISEIKQLNKVMQETMGVVRNENTLLNGIQTVQALTGNLPLLGMAVLKVLLQEKKAVVHTGGRIIRRAMTMITLKQR